MNLLNYQNYSKEDIIYCVSCVVLHNCDSLTVVELCINFMIFKSSQRNRDYFVDICVCVDMLVFVFMLVCVYVYVCLCTCVCIYLGLCMSMHLYVCIYACYSLD